MEEEHVCFGEKAEMVSSVLSSGVEGADSDACCCETNHLGLSA